MLANKQDWLKKCVITDSSKLTAVLKKLHGKSFNSLPFINNDNVSGVRLDSIFPPSDSDISSNREPTPDGMELKLEPDEQEVLTNGEVATTGEEINPAEHDHHSSSDVTDPPEETEKDSFVPDHSISSDKFLSSKDCLEKLECFNESATLTPTLADRETAEENVDVKNDDMKVSQMIDGHDGADASVFGDSNKCFRNFMKFLWRFG